MFKSREPRGRYILYPRGCQPQEDYIYDSLELCANGLSGPVSAKCTHKAVLYYRGSVTH